MSAKERVLLESFLRSSDHYLEFGCGVSTVTAAGLVGTSVTAIDSSQAWINEVTKTCAAKGTKITPRLVYVDIGPTGDWGTPTDPKTNARWPNYYEQIWQDPDTAKSDLFLVDGRFRVACFMRILLNCEEDSTILIHDFANRPYYHAIKQVAQQIAMTENLSAFRPRRGNFRAAARTILDQFRLNPA